MRPRKPIPDTLGEHVRYNPSTGRFFCKKPLVGSSLMPGDELALRTSKEGYRNIYYSGKSYRAARVAWFLYYGEQPPPEIDHKNGNSTDDRIENLREATPKQNTANKGMYRNNTSGHKGIFFRKDCNKWRVRLGNSGRIALGHFDTLEEAIDARDAAAKAEFGGWYRSR